MYTLLLYCYSGQSPYFLLSLRCDIPVVIMGETGCGKTRLIQYMCDLARCGKDLRNLLILKVIAGVTVNSG